MKLHFCSTVFLKHILNWKRWLGFVQILFCNNEVHRMLYTQQPFDDCPMAQGMTSGPQNGADPEVLCSAALGRPGNVCCGW